MKTPYLFACFIVFQFCIQSNIKAQAGTALPVSDTSCRTKFLKRVLADTGIYVPWIAIKIKDPQKEKLIVTQNNFLFRYLRKNDGFDFIKYQSYILALLKNKQPLVLNEITTARDNFFIEVDTTDSNHKFAREKGVKALRDEYFRIAGDSKGLLIMGIDIFFDNNYIVKRNDMSATLAILPFECR